MQYASESKADCVKIVCIVYAASEIGVEIASACVYEISKIKADMAPTSF